MQTHPFPLRIPESPRAVIDTLKAAGFEAFAVGGCVRDTLLGRTPEDWDITTNATPEAVRSALEAVNMKVVDTGLQHGTVTAVTGSEAVEVTTYRIDGPYRDGRRPEGVTFTADLEGDLARRDFTINAMAGDGAALVDPFGGRADLEAGIIRAVGVAEQRFQEDGLRVLRALRFASKLDFCIEAETADALRRCAPMLEKIAGERIRKELLGLLCGSGAGRVLREYYPILSVVIPEIIPSVGFKQCNYHHIYDVWEHTIRAIEAETADPVVRFVMLLHDLGKPHTFSLDAKGTGHFYGHGERSCQLAADILERLRMDSATRDRVLLLVKYHDSDVLATAPSLKRWLRRLSWDGLMQLLAVKRADNLAQSPEHSRQAELDALEAALRALRDEAECVVQPAQLAVSGNDLMALGLPQGPKIGRILEALLEAVTDGTCENDREDLLALAAQLM